ncbi:hypothetical protein IP84_06785 [beta proteobacterium AAP99]|nr:hypothetical protein IP84_06785 [beta proteobacterium AAP99]
MTVTIRCESLPYCSALDERAFFEWISRIPAITKVWGELEVLYLEVASLPIDEHDLRELLALLYRYDGPLDQLRQFENKDNRKWLRNPEAFWFPGVYGELDART